MILRNIGRKSINDFTSEDIAKSDKWAYKFWQQLGTKSPFFRKFFGDWRENDTSNIEIANEKGARKKRDVKNVDTKWNIILANVLYDETEHIFKKSAKYLPFAEDIVKKSILLDTTVIDDNENPYRSFMHKFYNIVNIENYSYLVTLLVDELNSKRGDIYRAYNVNDIKITPVAGSKVYKPSHTTGAGGSNTSISTVADLHALVKKYDKDFQPRPAVYHRKKDLALTAFVMLFTLIIILYFPVHLRNLVIPFCITLASGLCAYAIFQFFMKESLVLLPRISVWCFSPILLFVLFLISHSSWSPFASDISFSMEYDSGTSFHFIQQSALDVETALLKWNEFNHLTLHIDQGRASFTIIGGKKCDILRKIHNLSAAYPEIFFYNPEKHTRHAIEVTVYGNDVPEIENNILQLAKYVNKNADNVNIIYNFKSDVTNIILEIPVKCASVGLYPFDVYKNLYYTVSEPVVDKYFVDDVETDVKIRGDAKYRETLSGLLSFPVLSPFGMAGEVGDYINVRRESAQGRIYHKNRMRILSFSVTGIRRARLREIVSQFPFTGSCHGEVGQ